MEDDSARWQEVPADFDLDDTEVARRYALAFELFFRNLPSPEKHFRNHPESPVLSRELAYLYDSLTTLAVSKTLADNDTTERARHLRYLSWLAHGAQDATSPFKNPADTTSRTLAEVSPGFLPVYSDAKDCAACGKSDATKFCAGCVVKTGRLSLFDLFIRPIVTSAEIFAFLPKNVGTPIYYTTTGIYNTTENYNATSLHHAFLLRLPKSGLNLVLDPYGMALGRNEMLAPFDEYERHRMRYTYEHKKVELQTLSQAFSDYKPSNSPLPNLIADRAVLVLAKPIQETHGGDMRKLLDTKDGDEYSRFRDQVVSVGKQGMDSRLELMMTDWDNHDDSTTGEKTK
ncbi:hypothetical protein QBC35DRAFT_553291 [Podospora australis]|uniref:Uncharacterized protein n=1 Tax=Podospora australis TaxID=1536484 RepID=A0AAN6WRR1_9PEZI|nr:hypothetical protein QBC35DRAFT_553291 [Podospora australis]